MKGLAVFAMILLSGCAVEKRYQDMSYSERVALANKLIQSCRDQGVKDESPQMEVCFRAEADREITRRDEAYENLEMFGNAMSEGLTTYGNSMSQQASTYRRPVNCTSNTYGGSTYTNCY